VNTEDVTLTIFADAQQFEHISRVVAGSCAHVSAIVPFSAFGQTKRFRVPRSAISFGWLWPFIDYSFFPGRERDSVETKPGSNLALGRIINRRTPIQPFEQIVAVLFVI